VLKRTVKIGKEKLSQLNGGDFCPTKNPETNSTIDYVRDGVLNTP